MPARIPSYRLHKPSGQAVVTLSGKDHYLGRHGSPESRVAYERLLAEWLANRQRSSEPGTIRQALRPIQELYGETRARDFGPLALKAVRQAMIQRGWCRSFINKQ